MIESINDDTPQLSPAENEILTADFSENEVHDDIVQLEFNKAPEPDGFPAEFCHKF
jgi:hypothetical protein